MIDITLDVPEESGFIVFGMTINFPNIRRGYTLSYRSEPIPTDDNMIKANGGGAIVCQ